MPTPFDLLSAEMDDASDPADQLRNALGLQQGKNLAGGPLPPGAQPPDPTPDTPYGGSAAAQPIAPSPNVAGPLAVIPAAAKAKPRVKLKLKGKPKPRIKLKASAHGPV